MEQTSHPTPRLDSLPTELLLAILAHLPPPHIALGSGAAPAQRNALFALQRTSKRLKEVCAPVLWDRLEMDVGPGGRGETQRITAHLRTLHAVREGCRTLRLEAFDWSFMPPYLADGVRLLPNVEQLSMRETMPITLDVVARFDHLRYLDIEYAELLPSPSQITFAHLERMGLADTTIHLPSSRSSSFFDPSILPSLRQLRLGCLYLEGCNSLPGDHNDDGGGTVFSPALIRQLDQLHLELSSVYTLCDGVIPVEALGHDAPVLWHAALGATAPSFIGLPPPPAPLAFIRISLSEVHPDDSSVPQLRNLIAAHPFLRLVLVPLELWCAAAPPRSSRPAGAPTPTPALAALVAECAARGLAVRPYDAGGACEGFVPREEVAFWREEGVGRA